MKRLKKNCKRILSLLMALTLLMANTAVVSAADLEANVPNVKAADSTVVDSEVTDDGVAGGEVPDGAVTDAQTTDTGETDAEVDPATESEVPENPVEAEDIEKPEEPETEENAEAAAERAAAPEELGFVPGEVIVSYETGVTPEQAETTAREQDGTVKDTLDTKDGTTTAVVEISEDTTVSEAVAAYTEDPSVKFATPNYLLELSEDTTQEVENQQASEAASNDAQVSDQSYLSQIQVPEAWRLIQGTQHGKTKVVMLDTGVDINHEDLKNILNLDESREVIVENGTYSLAPLQGDGYVNGVDTSPANKNSHGTHVAGIISAEANNQLGIAGVGSAGDNSAIDLVAVDIFSGKETTSMAHLLKGLEYAESIQARVINLSLGVQASGLSAESLELLQDACDSAAGAGITLVCAAGNYASGDNGSVATVPSDFESTISVISVDAANTKAGTSNYGTRKDVSAPGVNIYSTYDMSSFGTGYALKSGTSMAAPMVTAAAAFLYAADSGMTPEKVKEIVRSTATDIGTEGYDELTGAGLLNVEKAVQAVVPDQELEEPAAEPKTDQKDTADSKTAKTQSKTAEEPTVTLKASRSSAALSNFTETKDLKKITFAVWSKTNGKDDLRWYDATEISSGTYKSSLSLKNHKSNGTYYVHAYAQYRDGTKKFIKSTSFKVGKPAVSSISFTNKNVTNGKFTVKVAVTGASLIKEVRIPVWCSEDQNDIVWYKAVEQSDGTYAVNVNISKHKYHTGTYQAHVYVTDIFSTQRFGKAASTAMSVTKGTMSVAQIKSSGTYAVNVSGIHVPAGEKSVRFAVWSEDKGQDDIKWYAGKKAATGTYTCEFSLENHKSYGKYNIHAYAQSKSGEMLCVGNKTAKISVPAIGSIKIQNRNYAKGTFQVRLSGITNTSAVSKISVPVWCADNQSDIVWYTAKRQTDGTFLATVSVSKHKYHAGTYQVHAYVTDAFGTQRFAGKTTSDMNTTTTGIKAVDSKKTETTYVLSATSVQVPAGAKNVKFAVWGDAGGQNDLKWYTATNVGTTYQYKLPIKNHKEVGKYNVHAYVVLKSGDMQILGTTGFTVTNKITGSIDVKNVNGDNGRFTIVASGVSATSTVQRVRAAVWSADNQSDIGWYDLELQSDGTYQCIGNVSNHQYHSGTYLVHMYVTGGNWIQTHAGSTSFTIKVLSAAAVEVQKYTYVPYVYGGKDTNGWDCSGFVTWALNNCFKLNVPYRTSQMYASAGFAIDKNNMASWQPGDVLVMYNYGHVALYLGDGMIMHAADEATGTVVVPLSSWLRAEVVAVRRILS
ncbi:GBS Bsp-like repeat-containing protein [Hespellia stercorisuis]|uniref:Serine protease, subtilisin family n=1 Tax=Hespellia stercorisuis DSM 15480 TaxID=1121950 RepID=A0A1M6Q626_9FIRM|nr:GBS Bsp-like repeat-containing protein [Hespellia stercorisuis]SHK15739.1 Serine protease, subtilisin family [Hespellia stercorisuis DSM 15480]